jgi:hypothetical protein
MASSPPVPRMAAPRDALRVRVGDATAHLSLPGEDGPDEEQELAAMRGRCPRPPS